MSHTATELMDAAPKLPPADREELAERLLDSLPLAADEEFAAELRRRMAESDRDPSARIPWAQVREMW
jgi:putative addiction module component (TIGR02574 family)